MPTLSNADHEHFIEHFIEHGFVGLRAAVPPETTDAAGVVHFLDPCAATGR
jgi:hypothetical protein